MATVTIAMQLDRETPGTFRFAAADSETDKLIETLYIRKDSARRLGLGQPGSITVTVETAD